MGQFPLYHTSRSPSLTKLEHSCMSASITFVLLFTRNVTSHQIVLEDAVYSLTVPRFVGLKQTWFGRLELSADNAPLTFMQCVLPGDKSPAHGWAFDLLSESGGSAAPIATTKSSLITVCVDTKDLRGALVVYLSATRTQDPQ